MQVNFNINFGQNRQIKQFEYICLNESVDNIMSDYDYVVGLTNPNTLLS